MQLSKFIIYLVFAVSQLHEHRSPIQLFQVVLSFPLNAYRGWGLRAVEGWFNIGGHDWVEACIVPRAYYSMHSVLLYIHVHNIEKLKYRP